jgi:hypothetical protein
MSAPIDRLAAGAAIYDMDVAKNRRKASPTLSSSLPRL